MASLVPKTWKADLTKPEVVILVEIFKTTCGISCGTDFNKFKKFNLHELVSKTEAGSETSDLERAQGKMDGTA